LTLDLDVSSDYYDRLAQISFLLNQTRHI